MNKKSKARFTRAVPQTAAHYPQHPDPDPLTPEESHRQVLHDLARLRRAWYDQLMLPHPNPHILAETYFTMKILVEEVLGGNAAEAEA